MLCFIFNTHASQSTYTAHVESTSKGAYDTNLHVHYHLLVHVSVTHDGAKLLERYLAILILVCEQDCLVYDLLELCVLQVVAHHHLQHLEQLPVRDEAVVIHVVDAEGEAHLALLVSLHAELRHALDELLEVDLAVAVCVEDVDDALHERVLLQLRQRHELLHTQRPAVVQVQLTEPLAQPPDLVGVEHLKPVLRRRVGAHLHGK